MQDLDLKRSYQNKHKKKIKPKVSNSIDLHGLTHSMALKEVQEFINKHYELGTEYIEVIHGYSHGDTLKESFSKKSGYHSNKVLRVEVSFVNPGASTVYLKKK